MILLDVNVLIRAHRPDLPFSEGARKWLEEALVGDERVAVWDVILISAYRILTHPKLVREPNAPRLALQFLQEVRDNSVVVQGSTRHWDVFRKLVDGNLVIGNLVTDAMIAAVCLETGCRLATFDTDFARFKGVQWFEPTVS